jgi:hypothetical protein
MIHATNVATQQTRQCESHEIRCQKKLQETRLRMPERLLESGKRARGHLAMRTRIRRTL